jgi:hypothetical protein
MRAEEEEEEEDKVREPGPEVSSYLDDNAGWWDPAGVARRGRGGRTGKRTHTHARETESDVLP